MLCNLNKLKLYKVSQYFVYIYSCYRQKVGVFFTTCWLHKKENYHPGQSQEWDTSAGQRWQGHSAEFG